MFLVSVCPCGILVGESVGIGRFRFRQPERSPYNNPGSGLNKVVGQAYRLPPSDSAFLSFPIRRTLYQWTAMGPLGLPTFLNNSASTAQTRQTKTQNRKPYM